MNSPYIGDRPLNPPEDDECETCGGHGVVGNILNAEPCPDCCYDADEGEPNDFSDNYL